MSVILCGGFYVLINNRSYQYLSNRRFVQDCNIAIATTLEILQSCTKLSLCDYFGFSTEFSLFADGHKATCQSREVLFCLVPLSLGIRFHGGQSFPCWRHQMETFSALLAFCEGNSPVTGEVPSESAVTPSFDVFFDLCPNKRLSKPSRRRWFKTPSHSLWRHPNALSDPPVFPYSFS